MALLITIAVLLLLLLAGVGATDTRDGKDWQPQHPGGPLSTCVPGPRRARPDSAGFHRLAGTAQRLAALARRAGRSPGARAGARRAPRPVGAVGADCAPS